MTNKVDFVWAIHPRDFKERSKYIPWYLKMLNPEKLKPRVIDKIYDTENNTEGLIIGTPFLPERLIKKNICKKAFYDIKQEIVKYSPKAICFGGWWGTCLRHAHINLSEEFPGVKIVNGVETTTDSIINDIKLRCAKKILIIGSGAIGTRLTQKLLRLASSFEITLLDSNLFSNLAAKEKIGKSKKVTYGLFDKYTIKELMRNHDIGVCAISGVKELFPAEIIPHGFKWIDDSYPHVIPNYPGRISGGLISMINIHSSSGLIDKYGVYGCLAELIKESIQQDTIGS